MKRTGAMMLAAGILFLGSNTPSQAAIALDRTRAIFPGSENSMALNISNESQKKPYLAQAWLENEQGQKLTDYLNVTPPLQRVEAGEKSVIRVSALPSAKSLPQDRETLFWFNLREIPPKSDRPNVLQVALQTKIKLFYRPAGIMPVRYSRQDDKLILHKVAGGYRVENPTPYYMTIMGITGGKKQLIPNGIKPVMIAPKSSEVFRSNISSQPWIISLNDFGGRAEMPFSCEGTVCRAADLNQYAG
ncbi:fimbria/pilus periplasmic chaperone [Enterobacter sp. Cy-643]|uniref:fimbrial biogenesis chaperone n=1 Tax=Enterobacter sp. Cy-643 TaxID=2608346 RepID=UPI0014242014|nr:fimbria/pilus periplasmic chaperone [Enterobacter sp. Cy-643]